MDTRQLRDGQVFVALRTGKRDGHDFLPAAQAAGASAAIVARADPALTLPQLVVADPLTAFQTIAREHR
ncbi:MAG TPA: Mur ligase domain-containing protein, partial [Rariglobus sp.]